MEYKILNGYADALIDESIDWVVGMGLSPVIVTDPPFNVGYHYDQYKDHMDDAEYYSSLVAMTSRCPSVVVLYPEMLHRLSIEKGEAPERVVSWVYPSNTAKQHRDVAYYGIKPDFRRVPQPYKNPNDKRIRARIAAGKTARLYDWWEINQVKNVSHEKTAHPCQMPREVMHRAVGILPDGIGIIDPFVGSGTTGVACVDFDIPFVGIDMDDGYCDIARHRMESAIAGEDYA